ncbi:hypothetical protein R9C00_04160 [Flammeovirgaceae bacterium SG7u.111]|nr:hypothetical protein [Flammeovirgaceae bacterium SG7u.132]WPO36641.1 hypothetical protein R9C00_04160 [Flammeovirgaceae bacterium SG7u.111]
MSDLSNIGKFVDQSAAIKELNAFLATVPDPNDPNLAVAFMFGLDKLTEFFDKVKVYNNGVTDPSAKVDAVRFYRSISEDSAGKEKLDLILIPVKTDGEDLIPIYKQGGKIEGGALNNEGGDDALTDSRPCPNQCDD